MKKFLKYFYSCFHLNSLDNTRSQIIVGAATATERPLVRLGGIKYAIITHVDLKLQDTTWPSDATVDLRPGEYMPVIVVSAECYSTPESFLEKIKSFEPPHDDVYSKHFLTDTIIVQGKPQHIQRLREQLTTLKQNSVTGTWNPERVLAVKAPSRETPDGPYFLSQGLHLSQAWRIYADVQDSFISSFLPSEQQDGAYQPLGVKLENGWTAIAVPSRLYSRTSSSGPLAGMRISIKDNFKISGIATTQSNRAWCDLYDQRPETETAAYVKKLISLGAVLVGKTKMCSFASSEEATDQWIDSHAPFNPRADGYQSPSGSTTGGGTSLAAYDWLDYSVGTDTTGSIRWPAAWCGLFGLRTTWRDHAMEGIYPACRFMDTIGLLSRSIDEMQKIVETTILDCKDKNEKRCDGVNDEKSSPTEILYPTDFFPIANADQQKMVDQFKHNLEAYLGITATEISISERWRESPPDEANGKSIQEYLEKTAYNPFYYDGYHEFRAFREEYEATFGKPVYVGPYMRWKWDRGSEVTKEMKNESLKEVEVYRRWFAKNVLHPTGNGGTSAIMLIPCGNSGPKYRDDANSPPTAVGAFTWNYIASVQGLPQLVAPIGELPYHSRVTNRIEKLPVVGSIIGAAGSDFLLVEIIKNAFNKANRSSKVFTGREMFKQFPGTPVVSERSISTICGNAQEPYTHL